MFGVKRKVVDDDAGQPLPKVENCWYKKKEFCCLLKVGLGDKLRKICKAAKEKDEAMDHKQLTTKSDEPDNRKKMRGHKGKAKDAKGSGDSLLAQGVAAITGKGKKELNLIEDSPRTELDSHADMCCVGKNVHILHTWPNKDVRVTPFLQNLGVIESTPIVSALIAYDDPSSGTPILLVINQAVYFDTLEHNLLCPMQLQHHVGCDTPANGG